MLSFPYRLALDLGSTSLGWAVFRINQSDELNQPDYRLKPDAIIKAGVRIFNSGRDPKTEASLAVTRRGARAMRRRRDRLLRRKARMMDKLVQYGFFPQDAAERKKLELLNPYELRAKGLREALTPGEFARALFHINQRRGFKSNRKTDSKESDSGALKSAISALRQALIAQDCQTVGELLHKRLTDESKPPQERTVRARYRETRVPREDGKFKIEKSYDLYIDRQMIADEFDTLWAKQAELNPALFTEAARADLRDTLLYQRKLRPVLPGRCTLIPEEPRAPLALPSTQRFRIYQEVNHLRILCEGLQEKPLTPEQRDQIVRLLESKSEVTFNSIRTKLKLAGSTKFNLEDEKRKKLKGNVTTAILSKSDLFGEIWNDFTSELQDEIVWQLLNEESNQNLIVWLRSNTHISDESAGNIADFNLPKDLLNGYGSLSRKALERILPALRECDVQDGVQVLRTYDKAVQAAGFPHHSDLGFDFEHDSSEVEYVGERVVPSTGEIKKLYAFKQLPYYGRALQRHVAFAKDKPCNDEERHGKIANPTVHIGLNQIRTVVNALIRRYGRPTEIVVELARDLKQSREQKQETQRRQADNQRRNDRIRKEIAAMRGILEHNVKVADIQKWILWEELSFDVANRRCPYSGVQISAAMLLSDQVEIEHILPFSQTLDDSRNNRTVSMRAANRIKGNCTPWDAREDFEKQGWSYDSILLRAEHMPKGKRYRFAADGYAQWLRNEKGFLARALNDTRYLSRVAREYLTLICPQIGCVRVIPGQMTAMLRAKFGLNDVLGLNGEKNRNDHRHHAVDACVIGVTDQGLLQRFASASADARNKGLDKLVEEMPLPWKTYRDHVKRAVRHIWVSHKPDHGHEGAMFDATIYNAQGHSKSAAKDRAVRPFFARAEHAHLTRYRKDAKADPKPYKGLLTNDNYCIEITRNSNTRTWEGQVLSTFEAYQIMRRYPTRDQGLRYLRNKHVGSNGESLVMRLSIGDCIATQLDGETKILQVLKINSSGSITFIRPNETNISARYTAKLAAQKHEKANEPFDKNALNDTFFQQAFSANSLFENQARRVTISPIGELRDPGFKD